MSEHPAFTARRGRVIVAAVRSARFVTVQAESGYVGGMGATLYPDDKVVIVRCSTDDEEWAHEAVERIRRSAGGV